MSLEIRRRELTSDVEFDASMHPLLKRIYAARNIQSTDELDYSFNHLLPFHDLKGIKDAVALLIDAIENDKRILIIADFDADGATSCALAIRGLGLFGLKNLGYLVPNRFEYGYGLSPEIVEVAAAQQPDLIITVDNGISSLSGVRMARKKGIDVLITDHHLPGEELPEATAIINPNQKGDLFPGKSLAGVGVIFYVLLALRAELRDKGWFVSHDREAPNLADLLDLVALGTIADLVPLDHNNRILVAQGVARIKAGKCCAGIKALLKVAKCSLTTLTAQDLGFTIAPRLNAAGRLTDMSLGIECLLTDDIQHATQLARQLDQLNQERKQIQDNMQDQALTNLENLQIEKEDMPPGLCMFDESWHQGIIGILASRIKDEVHRPVIAFARENETLLKGSARSIKGVHIRDVIDAVASQCPGMIDKFGGHAMAAGLTISISRYDEFQNIFNQVLDTWYARELMEKNILTDGTLDEDEMNMEVARLLMTAGPWGQGFPEPLFDGEFEVLNSRIVGEKHLKLQLKQKNKIIEAIAFNYTDEDWPVDTTHVQTVYRLDINEFAGRQNLQLIVEEIVPLI